MTEPFSILFVCTGNICRSPTAEAVFRAEVKKRGLAAKLRHDSAGTADYHTGEAPDPRSRRALAARGVIMDDLKARKVTIEDFYDFDLILAMDRTHLDALERMAPKDATAKIEPYLEDGSEVPDPYYGGEAGFEHVIDLAYDATEALLNRFKQQNLL